MANSVVEPELELVPNSVTPQGSLPPLRYRDLPEPSKLRHMIGPGIILAGLSLGSGEFVLWPYITYKSQFVFFWACMLGLITQYFINMEITRWTLATGETAIGGFCRLSKHWAWVFLIANIVPHMIPAWSKGAAELLSWLIWNPDLAAAPDDRYVTPLAIGGMFLCGAILTAGPVIYQTVEKIQMALVSLILVLVVIIAFAVVRADAIEAQFTATATLGYPNFVPELTEQFTSVFLLGALAFAGCGGTLNLTQSNYIRDKGYGMGKFIGRMTSPVTGQEEPIATTGYLFHTNEDNMRRWRSWWRLASAEHFLSFFCTCAFCLITLTLITYSLLYTSEGVLRPEAASLGEDMSFIRGEARELSNILGPWARVTFIVMGIAILLTTEFGILDAASRVSTDIIKVNWLRDNDRWTESRIYYTCLWTTIVFGTGVLLIGQERVEGSALGLFKLTSSISGGVMCLYSATLLALNFYSLPRPLRMTWYRVAIMIWAVLFFGFFAVWAGWSVLG